MSNKIANAAIAGAIALVIWLAIAIPSGYELGFMVGGAASVVLVAVVIALCVNTIAVRKKNAAE